MGDFDVGKLKQDLERARKSEKELEANLKVICDNPWFSNSQNQANIAEKLRNNDAQILALRTKLLSDRGLREELEQQKLELEKRVEQLSNEKSKAEDELVRFTTLLEEQQKTEKTFGGSVGAGPAVPVTITDPTDPKAKLIYMADEMNGKSPQQLVTMGVEDASKDNGTGWYRIKLIERDNRHSKLTPEEMIREIEKLVLENGELASHFEKSTDMLNIYREMETDKRRAEEIDVQILDAKIREASNQVDDLYKLIKMRTENGADRVGTADVDLE